MAIRSKYNHRHKYMDLEPIFDSRTGVYLGQFMAYREGLNRRVQLLKTDVVADSAESRALLDSFKTMRGEKEEG